MTAKALITAALLVVLLGCDRTRSVDSNIEWMVMGTTAALRWKSADGAVADAEQVKAVFSKIERLLNAHDVESELSKLACFEDDQVLAQCDDFVRTCYEAAFKLREQTDGMFNPRWKGPATLDLGAIAKGYAVDVAAESVAWKGRGKMLIDLGGNLKAVKGDWNVGVFGDVDETFLLKEGEACATSARYFRGDHIKDGRDGEAIMNTLYSVTVIHPTSAMLADGLSTVCFILGREAGDNFLQRLYPEAKVIWK